MSSRAPRVPSLGVRMLGLVLLALLGTGCPAVRGVVNDSPGLRWWLFSNFGAQRMCPEMLKRGAPLKLAPNGNTIGRFFPEQCHMDVNNQAQTVTIRFSGTGYAWTPFAGRIGFSADTAVEYRPDFYMAKDAIYVYARFNRLVYGPEFKIGSVENKVVDWATRTPVGYMANTFGNQIAQSQLTSGFTVVHSDEGDDFSLGILTPPQKPSHPFNTKGSDRYVFANETTEVHPGEVDFLGPFEITDDDQSLYLRFRVDGPAVDALVMPRGNGDLWRNTLQLGAPLAPPLQPPMASFVIPPGAEQSQKLKLPKGQYYVVIDNSNAVGQVSPPWNPLNVVGGGTANVSYVAEVGD